MLQIKLQKAGSRPEWLVEKRYTFGTGSDNHYTVRGESVHTLQAGLDVNGDKLYLVNLGGGTSVKVNDKILKKLCKLKPGDVFCVGDTRYEISDPKQSIRSANAQISQHSQQQPDTRWTLKAHNTALANKSYVLEGTKVIGRSTDCDICLNIVHLSRRHAQLTANQDFILIEDLQSSNGTFINGVKVSTARAKAGDEIAFDTLSFTLIRPEIDLGETCIRSPLQHRATQQDITTQLRRGSPTVRPSKPKQHFKA